MPYKFFLFPINYTGFDPKTIITPGYRKAHKQNLEPAVSCTLDRSWPEIYVRGKEVNDTRSDYWLVRQEL